MLTLTDRAREVVLSYIEQSEGELRFLRITPTEGQEGQPPFELSLVSEADREEDEIEVDVGEFTVLVPLRAASRLEGAVVDFVERVNESGFEVRTAQGPPSFSGPPTGPLADRVRQVLEEQINPAVASHGGAITLVDVQGTEIYIQMGGGCQGCALSRMTLKQGVERMVRQAVPEVTAVHDVTDHTSGVNPYY